ncbi:hypothetical protein [Methyloceanibacter sp.]|uniref:hypothetical protein n=1 Tax=Methyloceanibacter sp. TaxID=1965321 RepID=UPI003D6D13C2
MRASSEDLLHRYPGPVLLRASRRNWLFTFITCIVFTVIGILMIRDGEMTGWLLIIFFGLGTPIAFVICCAWAGCGSTPKASNSIRCSAGGGWRGTMRQVSSP